MNGKLAGMSLVILGLLIAQVLSFVATPAALPTNWSGPTPVPPQASLTLDSKLKFLDGAPAPGTSLKGDPKLEFVDANNNGVWDVGESVVYDTDANNKYNSAVDILVAGATPTSALHPADPKVKFVDTNKDGLWDPGETVVYDPNNNSLYDSGERVIAGISPGSYAQSTVKTDPKIKFWDSNSTNKWVTGDSIVYDSNSSNTYNANIDLRIRFVDSNSNVHWDSNETVVYDADNSGTYTSGDTLVAGTTPTPGAALRNDARIRFVDSNRNGAFDTGEAVVYDNDTSTPNNVYDNVDNLIAGVFPPSQSSLTNDAKIKFLDKNSNGIWDLGETIAYDSNGDNLFGALFDPHIKFWNQSNTDSWATGKAVVYDSNNNGIYDSGEACLTSPSVPCPNSIDAVPVKSDPHFRFLDPNRAGHWECNPVCDSVVYDTNGNNVYDSGDLPVAGAPPATGTPLYESVISGVTPAIGTTLKSLSTLRLVDANANSVWDPGEAVIYDANNDQIYDSGDTVVQGVAPLFGTLLSEPVIYGAMPPATPSPTNVKVDPNIRYVDVKSDNHWDPGDPVFYDTNGNGSYDSGEPVMAGGASSIDGKWHQGDTVIYDSSSDGVYNTGDPLVNGTLPVLGTRLTFDANVTFVDAGTYNGHWDPGEPVVYDADKDNLYQSTDVKIAGVPPPVEVPQNPVSAQDAAGRIWLLWGEGTVGAGQKDIFYRIWSGSAWGSKQPVTLDPSDDSGSSATPLVNNTLMTLWSSARTGNGTRGLFYKFFPSGNPATAPFNATIDLSLTNPKAVSPFSIDTGPSVVQDRLGRIWVVWARQKMAPVGQEYGNIIYYKYYDGVAWSSDFALPVACGGACTNQDETLPSITQAKDGRIWIAWAGNDTGVPSIYYTTTDGTVSTLPSTGISSWSARTTLVSDGNINNHPSIIQSRDGVLWVFFGKSVLGTQGTSNIWYTNSANNGGTWSTPATFTSETDPNGPTDQNPSAVQVRNPDGRVWVFWIHTSQDLEIWYSQSPSLGNLHDLGLTGLFATPIVSPNSTWQPSKRAQSNLIKSGGSFNISVTVVNYGNYPESATLKLKLNSTAIPVLNTWSFSIASGGIQVFKYAWNTTYPFYGRFNLNATLVASGPISGESSINAGDDSVAGRIMRVSPPGDVDGNGVINILDAAQAAFVYGTTKGVPHLPPYDSDADIDHNGTINILDMAILAFYYQKSV